MLRVGSTSPLPRARAFIQGFEARMRELGYIEGQNLTVDYVEQRARPEGYTDAMQHLVDRKVDVLIASGPDDSLKAADNASNMIPIVMAAIESIPLHLG